MKDLLLCFLLLAGGLSYAQGVYFSPTSPNKQLPDQSRHRLHRTDRAWVSELKAPKQLFSALQRAPHERQASVKNGAILELPTPEGEALSFRVVRYDLLSPSARQLMPEFITAYGEDVEGRGLRISLSWSVHGFNASVRGGQEGRWYIDPVFAGDDRYHQTYYLEDAPAMVERACLVEDDVRSELDYGTAVGRDKTLDDCRLRTHELALACTGEYFQYMVNIYGGSGNDYATVFTRMGVTMNRVNGIFREDLGIVFTLVNQMQMDTVQLLYDDGATDPYTNSNTSALLPENQANTDNVIGIGNYDLGHVFSTDFGGLAGQGICFDNRTARGATGLPSPEGDPFDVDFVAHEMGHQLGANHTFNTGTGSCSGTNRNAETAYEPGSGTTIMGYAGICSPHNIQSNSDAYFSAISLEEISDAMNANFSNYFPLGCAILSGGNTPPTPNAGPDYKVPLNTPFLLTDGGSSDPDGGTLTYCWEQFFPLGTTITQVTPEPTGSETGAPLFRSRPPTTETSRYFPELNSVVNNVTTGDWETLPQVPQTLQFSLTVRDGTSNGGYGCPQYDVMEVEFVNTNSQFGVSAPNGGEIFQTGSTTTVTWNEAGTASNPINCSNVDVLLSTDGGFTYTPLLTNVLNNGMASVSLPTAPTSSARIMVRCNGGIFYDISNADFSIQETEFTFVASEAEVGLCQGEAEATFTVDVASTQGYTGSIDCSVLSGLPAGATASWSVNPVVFNAGNANTTQTVTLTISNLAAAAADDYNIQVQGADGSDVKAASLMLNVGDGPLPLFTPADGGSELLGQGAGGENNVDFSFLSVDGRNRYIISYQVVRSGNVLLDATIGVIYSGNPGPNFQIDITRQLANGIQDGDVIPWFVTASDDNGVNPNVVSCNQSFTFRTILPVNWLSFEARAVDKAATLTWVVEQDLLNAGFTVERQSARDGNWRALGYVSASGPEGRASYRYRDETVAAGHTYVYRLRQEDSDGSHSYSELRSVTFAAGSFALTARPNPTNDLVFLQAGAAAPTALNYQVYNGIGQLLTTGKVLGGQALISLANFPPALYNIRVSDGRDYEEMVRIVKR